MKALAVGLVAGLVVGSVLGRSGDRHRAGGRRSEVLGLARLPYGLSGQFCVRGPVRHRFADRNRCY